MLSRLQRGIETLYRVDTQLDVADFLIDDGERRASGVARAPREQLLVSHDAPDSMRLGLFLDGNALANLEQNDPSRRLDQGNFEDFCLAVEGVSHFIYVALCAAGDRAVTPLELELQAEVDKFACCVLLAPDGADARGLQRKLYDDVSFAHDLDRDERDRYRVANGEARRYAGALAERFVESDRVAHMLPELRLFYRLTLDDKLGHINRVTK